MKISEGRKQRIVVRSTDSPAKVAKDFVERHGLDAVSQIELEETLRAQMAISFTLKNHQENAIAAIQKPQTESLLSQRTGASKKGAVYKR